MSKKVNPAAVGIFVAGAILILVATIVILGSGKWFEIHERFVIYFQSTANGLQEGSDVLLGGVKVGNVERMQVQFDPTTREKLIRVVIEISADRLTTLTVGSTDNPEAILSAASVERAVNELGLRASLMTKSVLTGQLFVDLDFFPNDPGSYRFSGDTSEGLVQIPSIKNEVERIFETIAEGVDRLSQIDFTQMFNHLDSLMLGINKSVSELDTQGISDRTKKTLELADSALVSFGQTASKLDELVESIDKTSANTLIVNANSTMLEAAKALREIEAAAGNISKTINPDAAAVVRLNRTLAEIEEVSRAVRDLTEYLKRNPNALITGKKQP